MLRDFKRKAFGESQNTPFCRAIRSEISTAHQRIGRRVANNRTVAPFNHVRNGVFTTVENACQITCQDSIPVPFSCLDDRTRPVYSSITKEHIEPFEFIDDVSNHSSNVSRLGYIS